MKLKIITDFDIPSQKEIVSEVDCTSEFLETLVRERFASLPYSQRQALIDKYNLSSKLVKA